MTKQDLRIVYLGTPEFAVASLRALVEGGYNVVAVVTMPDKPAGRGHQLQYSDVKKYALEVGLPVLQPEKLKDEAFVEELRSYQADLQIVVAFRMLPEVVWAMPRLGTFNIHGSLLPQYRGAAPINWAVMNGEKETGLTTFMLKHEIDTGNMILQERIAIGEDENVGSVHDRLMALSESMVIRTVDLIIDCENKGIHVPTTPQPEIAELKPAPKIFKEDCEILFAEKTAQEVKNFVRGLSPYPAAWANLTIHGQTFENVKIFSVEVITPPQPSPQGREIIIPCREGAVSIKELQVPGKKRMDIKAFLNGLKPLPCPPLKGGSQER
ncbi:MAG: methionyl-tRNA formyltransferase [Paludibacteraceae bacterium]|nr:methionyl-tRNA formyltransferase [Paludibacteraceae bacterium]MDD6747672.1 methionyl-tRNA formyltransferase [Paludibacteraceae bacterium]